MAEISITTSVSGSNRGKHKHSINKTTSATIAMKMETDGKRFPSQFIDYVAQ